MISWLVGSQVPTWEYMRDLFEDVENVAVYANQNNVVELIKMSDIEPLHSQVTVLIHPKNIGLLKPAYLKLRDYVAFPVFDLSVLRRLVSKKSWRGIEYYYQWEFQGGWALYDCRECESKQRAHLDVNPTDPEAEKKHLEILSSK
ncbi:hypothetical protein [Metallosphaera hakonensis]|uniref:Uncharacterized protein n=1 Tax=Metallosphaera hakonensis JCM 8857 = DSM 7519 TaxID=1293036 RepID=A0A2U9ISX4_9CREN|nr:hypothetical protein [Metallosphaera hakonensis]AWR99138.1 hypothetical protein DFR87_04855 [Metallosphaera hakonensis JCM 8857 = DSM 7519]